MVLPKYIVAQVGARRGYAVPAILASAGMLARFYTDICGNVGLGRLFSLGAPISPSMARLAHRRVPSSVLSLTRTYPVRSALHLCRGRLGVADSEQSYLADLSWQCSLGHAVVREKFADATHVFSM